MRACVAGGFALEEVLPLVTANTARVLQLSRKGKLAAGADADADVLVPEPGSLVLTEVIENGRRLVKGGYPVVRERWQQTSDREQAGLT